MVWLALRPEKIALTRERPDGNVNALAGTIAEIGYRGDRSIYKIRLADASLMRAAVPNAGPHIGLVAGDAVWVSWMPDAGVVLTR
jgi:putrescine transport system ATP-binding protein